MTFKEKVQKMTAKEIIMAMVKGLQNPYTTISMADFGIIRDGICYGCAATNSICVIENRLIQLNDDKGYRKRQESLDNDVNFVVNFELAIDCLRSGSVKDYNIHANGRKFAIINPYNFELPKITDENYNKIETLQPYIDLANAQ